MATRHLPTSLSSEALNMCTYLLAVPKPENVRLEAANFTGSVRADWQHIRGAKSYKVQYTPDVNDPTQWKDYEVTTRSNMEMEGLESGKVYWMRVAAIGAIGQDPWSEATSSLGGPDHWFGINSEKRSTSVVTGGGGYSITCCFFHLKTVKPYVITPKKKRPI